MDPDSWLGAYVIYTTSLLTWMKVPEQLYSRRETIIVIKLIYFGNVCLSHFKTASIFSTLKSQHLRAMLLRNHFILTAKVHFITQRENGIMLGASIAYKKAQSHYENEKSCW